jgi:cell division protein FtsW
MNRGDRWLLVLPLLLTALGVIMVYSSSTILGITRYQDPNYFLVRQVVRVALGVAVLLLCAAKADLRKLERVAPVLLGVAVVLLLLVIAAGHEAKGATRQLRIGPLTLSPIDLARLAAVAFLAYWLKRRPPAEHGFVRGLLPPLAVVGVVGALVLKQPNLSSAVLLGATGIGMLFLAGARLRHLAVPVGAGLLVAPLMMKLHPYQMERVTTFLRYLFTGELDRQGAGWNLDQSLIAIGSGGWFGRGPGGSLQKYLFLPEAHTDFIFSILAEELGFIGATALLGLFALLLWRCVRVVARAEDPFQFLLAGGLTLQIGLYALVNVAVAAGLVPTTGLPLPFVSYGGSALLANLAAAGLLYRVSAANASADALARQRWSGSRP